MAGMGPPPKRPAGRRKGGSSAGLTGTVTYLPAEGREGDAPQWPLGLFLDGEWAMWQRLWATPQAAAWEAMGAGTVDVVAEYVRERCSSKPDKALLLRTAGVLGLTPEGMLRLRWQVAADELAVAREGVAPAAPAARRIRAVE